MIDKQIRISTAGGRKSIVWPTINMNWSEFVTKLKTPQRTEETYDSYMSLPKGQQDDLKDVGGFVGGVLKDNRRKAANVLSRDLITLDMDNIPAGEETVIESKVASFGCAYAIYSTRKHSHYKPRLRVIIPTDRTMTPDEYEPVARKVAEIIGMGYSDPTTFQGERLMYWPSCSSNSDYFFKAGDGKGFISVDGILKLYANWQDITSWPKVAGQTPLDHKRLMQKQGDPLAKEGIVGAFCRTYSLTDAMETYLPHSYLPTAEADRFTYAGGSTSGGAILYDDKFIYSHHATDPCSGKLCNAFDMVRLHLFSEKDDTAVPRTPTNRLPSYSEMCKLARADEKVTYILRQETYNRALVEFGTDALGLDKSEIESDSDNSWLLQLESTDGKDAYAATINNLILILSNDPELKGKIALDEFANRGITFGNLPWDRASGRRNWTDTDDAGLRYYLEVKYKISHKEKIFDALILISSLNKFDDVRDYLNGLNWDGVKRLDTLLPDYLGAEDNPYTRAVSRKSLTAAVARAMVPGIKYDYMPILSGPQGIGKSTFLAKLGKGWYSDSLTTFEGKEAAEMIQGYWINEVGELNGLNKSETNAVKQFLSKREDVYRAPYGRRTEAYKRRCIFFGTSNDSEFLKDRTGNRRFWPVDVGIKVPTKSVFNDLDDNVNQIWAEAVVSWKSGELLYMSGEIEKLAREEQEKHMESNSKEGIILEYLDKEIPLNWDSLDIPLRRNWYQGMNSGAVETMQRDKVCVMEIWVECFGNDPARIRRQDSIEISNILYGLKSWKKHKSTNRFGPYGIQKGFIRIS